MVRTTIATDRSSDGLTSSPASPSDSPPPAPLPRGDGRGWILDANHDADAEQLKREYHRDHMVAFRQRKKQSFASMQALHATLEAQLAKRLTLRRALLMSAYPLDRLSEPETNQASPAHGLARFRATYGDLVDEAEQHRAENAVLRKQLDEFVRLKLLLHHELGLLCVIEPEPNEPTPSSHTSTKTPSRLHELRGVFVYFDDHEPPLYIERFTQRECDEAARIGHEKVRVLQDAFNKGGGATGMREVQCMGWRAQRSLQRTYAADGTDGPLISRVRFTKRIGCAAGEAVATIGALATYAYEWLSSAEKYASIQRTKFVSHTLQTFGTHPQQPCHHHVSLRNAPDPSGSTKIRYLHLLTRIDDTYTSTTGDERVRATVLMLAMDSPRHQRIRDVMPRDDLIWMTEGTAFTSFVQLDDATFEIDFGNVSTCVSDEQAHYFMVELGAQLLRWETAVMPPRLLAFGSTDRAVAFRAAAS